MQGNGRFCRLGIHRGCLEVVTATPFMSLDLLHSLYLICRHWNVSHLINSCRLPPPFMISRCISHHNILLSIRSRDITILSESNRQLSLIMAEESLCLVPAVVSTQPRLPAEILAKIFDALASSLPTDSYEDCNKRKLARGSFLCMNQEIYHRLAPIFYRNTTFRSYTPTPQNLVLYSPREQRDGGGHKVGVTCQAS